MLPERAEEMLSLYRPYLGRCSFLEAMVLRLENSISEKEISAKDELITASGKPPDGMPRGSTVGNPTERIGLMLASGYQSDEVAQLWEQINEYQEEIADKYFVVMCVESWLKGLTSKERWIVECIFFDKMSYNEINPKYRDVYGESCSKDSLRRIKKDALAKIYKMAE